MNSITSFESLLDRIDCLYSSRDYEQSLSMIHDYVDKIVTEPLCTSNQLGSFELDSLCQKIGSKSLEAINFSYSKQDKKTFTYVVTKIQKSGGHSRVISDLISAMPTAKHVILITGLEGGSNLDFFMRRFAGFEFSVEHSPTRGYFKTLCWLQERLIQLGADNNYLFNHHQDSVAVAAFQPGMLKKASFYHHGDHHLCLGVYLKHLEHIDFHPMGYHHCKDLLKIENKYLPLISEDKGMRSDSQQFKKNGYLITASAARSNKIEIPYYVSYLEVIPEILKVTKGKHIHIGKLSPWALFKIRRRLKRIGVPTERFVYIPWVPSVWTALRDHGVDLYIASFPYGGALTLIEAMGAGIPVALHKHMHSRVLSCIDMAYQDVFYWEHPEKLINYCGSVTSSQLLELSFIARAHYEKYHAPEILPQVLNGLIDCQAPSNIIKHFELNADEVTFWTERQVSAKHLLGRGIYRFLKKMRARFF